MMPLELVRLRHESSLPHYYLQLRFLQHTRFIWWYRMTQILLASNRPLIKSGIRATLATQEDLTLVGESINCQQAKQLSREFEPNVLLLDLDMPSLDLAELMVYLHQHCPKVRVLVLASDMVHARASIATGVAGYVLKEEPTEVLLRAVCVVAKGDTWFSRSVLEQLVQVEDDPAQIDNLPLTNQEKKVLAMIAKGWDNNRIAAELCLARQTVRNYASRIYPKLLVSSRVEAILWARKQGLVEEP